MRHKATFFFVLLTTIAWGQNNNSRLFKFGTREWNKHFRPPPTDIEAAIFQLNNNLTDSAKNYFRNLPEKIAILQFSDLFYYVQFPWKMYKKSETMYSIKKTNSPLIDHFIKNGASGDYVETIRLITAGLHRNLNNKTFTISELHEKYNNRIFKVMRDSIRDVNPKDTVFGSWFVPKPFFHRFSYSAWFEVISKNSTADSLRVKILKLQINDQNVGRVKAYKQILKVGDTTDLRNGELRNWKEVNKLYYSN
jgi:hypothetical protein